MKIGDTVFIIGKYTFFAPAGTPKIIEAKISHIKHRQFVAYEIDNEHGEWCFSQKHLNVTVFLTRKEAENVLKELEKNG